MYATIIGCVVLAAFLMVEPTNSDDEGFEIIEWSTGNK